MVFYESTHFVAGKNVCCDVNVVSDNFSIEFLYYVILATTLPFHSNIIFHKVPSFHIPFMDYV